MPINARNGVNEVGLNKLIKKFSLVMAFRLKSHAVKVVPRFAPRIILTASPNVMMPELTSPTTITVEADED